MAMTQVIISSATTTSSFTQMFCTDTPHIYFDVLDPGGLEKIGLNEKLEVKVI